MSHPLMKVFALVKEKKTFSFTMIPYLTKITSEEREEVVKFLTDITSSPDSIKVAMLEFGTRYPQLSKIEGLDMELFALADEALSPQLIEQIGGALSLLK